MALGNKRALLYDKLHKIAFFSILGLSAVTATLLGYNIYLFKIEGVPMLVGKYRAKAEEQMEIKQREAEYLEQKKKSENEFFNLNKKD